MFAATFVEWVSIAELFLLTGLLLLMWRRHALREFPMLTAFLAIRCLYGAITTPLTFFHNAIGMSAITAYHILVILYWPSCILQAILMILLVYGIYNMALAPFGPLKKLGAIIFRWIAAISVAVSLGVALGPHMFRGPQMAVFVGQMQQGASILTLCLLLFVCFALKPLGLTYGSRAFGVSLGLGILATTQLLQSSWLPTTQAASVYSVIYFYSGLGACAALLVWTGYFAFPEPERSMVLLPTTSPYFFWNKISEALGDSPGFVAISGFSPDSMAPGELAAMIEASQPRVEQMPAIMQPIAVNR
ncbi:MAG TPA: hypothetical protein VIJ79_04760 [Acidobacteriaceae bacterium]